MSWNCPHCSGALTVPATSLKDNWSFVRCFQCGGFALLRLTQTRQQAVDDRRPVIIASSRRRRHSSIVLPPPPPKRKITPPPFVLRSKAADAAPKIAPPSKSQEISILKIPAPLPELSRGAGTISRLTPWFAAALGTLLLSLGLRIHQIYQPEEVSSENAPVASSSDIQQRIRKAAAIKNAVSEIQASGPSAAQLTDEVRQQAMAPVRTSKP